MSKAREYDVILYGASGFVGRQTVRHFAQHGQGLRWALAGRNAEKLAAVKRDAGEGAAAAGIVVADAKDVPALDALARSARVVLSTAGPYAFYGSELVAACVRNRSHYTDITGETPWVRDLIDRHHDQAARDGTRIIPCCGFDSIPSDLGSLLLTTTMREHFDAECASVKACFSMRGGLNGGTLASLLNMVNSGKLTQIADPFLLNPPHQRPRSIITHADPVVPHYDGDFGAWVGPFIMGPINTRVVRRSAALLSYGDEFHYQEFMHFGASPAAGLKGGAGAAQPATLFGALRDLVGSFAPQPGEGPSEESMDRGSFSCELVARSGAGHSAHGRIADQGDPGNRATTKFVCEAALALVKNADKLPGGKALGGVLTPASGLGLVLAERLRAVGMTVEVAAG